MKVNPSFLNILPLDETMMFNGWPWNVCLIFQIIFCIVKCLDCNQIYLILLLIFYKYKSFFPFFLYSLSVNPSYLNLFFDIKCLIYEYKSTVPFIVTKIAKNPASANNKDNGFTGIFLSINIRITSSIQQDKK